MAAVRGIGDDDFDYGAAVVGADAYRHPSYTEAPDWGAEDEAVDT